MQPLQGSIDLSSFEEPLNNHDEVLGQWSRDEEAKALLTIEYTDNDE